MTNEELYNSISEVSAEFLKEAETYKPQKRKIWKKWTAAAACFVLLVVAAVLLFHGNDSVSPLIVTAYAEDANGELVGHYMLENGKYPVKKYLYEDGTMGFRFSIGKTEPNQPVSIMCITAGECDRFLSEDTQLTFAGDLEQGVSYVEFIGYDISDFEHITFFHKNDDETLLVEMTMSITETENGYMAELTGLTPHKIKN